MADRQPAHRSVGEMWQAYLNGKSSQGGANPPHFSTWHFSDNEREADELAALVLDGRKRATASSVLELERGGEPIPQEGDLSVVTNWAGMAQCVIRTTAVEIVPFSRVSERFAAVEGEGDGSLEYWRRVHWDYYQRVLRAFGKVPTRDMQIVCEEFEVVFELDTRSRRAK